MGNAASTAGAPSSSERVVLAVDDSSISGAGGAGAAESASGLGPGRKRAGVSLAPRLQPIPALGRPLGIEAWRGAAVWGCPAPVDESPPLAARQSHGRIPSCLAAADTVNWAARTYLNRGQEVHLVQVGAGLG